MNQIFFVYYGENVDLSNLSLSTFIKRPTFGYGVLASITLLMFVVESITHESSIFANYPLESVNHREVWRIVTSPFASTQGLLSFFWLICNLWWMLSLFPQYENKFSTVHLLVEVLLQNVFFQMIYCFTIIILSFNDKFSNIFDNSDTFSMGWDPIIIIWIFLITGSRKDKEARLFYLPLKVKNQYLVWLISGWSIVFSQNRIPLIIATVMGALQFHICYQSIVKLPYKWYVELQKPFLNCYKHLPAFVRLQDVRRSLYPLYARELEEMYGKEQYFLNYFSEQDSNTLMFHQSRSHLPEKKVSQQLDKWINQDDSVRQVLSSTKSVLDI